MTVWSQESVVSAVELRRAKVFNYMGQSAAGFFGPPLSSHEMI
jgi:hypothetical protein